MAEAGRRRRPIVQRRPRLGPRLTRANIVACRVLVLIVFVALWSVTSAVSGGNFLPSPWTTVRAAGEVIANGTILRATGESLLIFLSGYALAAAVAIPIGLLMGGIRLFGAALEPYVDGLSATPRVAFIPLIIVFLGLGYEAKTFIVFLGAVMPILINTYAGVLNCDGELIEMARSAGAGNRQIFRKIMLPGALPYVIAGLRVGAALALINTVVADLYTSVEGLGGLLALYGNSFRMAPYFVVVFTLAAIGVVATQSLRLMERRVERWRYRGDAA